MKILVADDNAVFGILITEVLTKAGYEVSVHENGQLAWDYLQTGTADMAVLDVNMPEINGLELLARMRADERFRKMPVIMLTVRAEAKDQVAGYESGPDDYLPKPFSNDVLLARIEALVRRVSEKGQ